ncbi:hypothetical protein KL918_003032 [Ogataea parapolymorpha]|uniref:Glutamine amidotransferase domain-containing protein n=1 Tax=Ogataea parapolymorpha (strain ATCC 26012 / BCRC 20466 / JCM 22074 / NRRL Y-7560 / DL-1) TaxID=871575 RepID=W1QBE8_OGAPD|nr:hypothetical protein HPODL_01749 [Ogataea parapolymorpha DL-1]ESW97658.1 hypothetical protein HPODL_01749 [Ogataea parapolymorpha DL-1]KAG7866837.1 hypothetical protein KL918_003032 [Ogataea parapolymorpha]KAG7871988.1 hypothetical protein KL916_003591 [Ogataea parapolymorpha]
MEYKDKILAPGKSMDDAFVAILVCDTPIDALSEFGDFGDQAIALFRAAGMTDTLFRKYDVISKMEYPTAEELQRCQGLYLTGSRSDAFANSPWIDRLREFVRMCLQEYQFPITASCFGHQLVATALGLAVGRSPRGWEMGLTQVQINSAINLRPLISNSGKNNFTVMEMHQDEVLTNPANLPPGYVNVGSSAACGCQGLYKKHRVLTFQGHPEFTTACGEVLVESRRRAGQVDAALYNDAKSRNASLSNDGVEIGRCMVELFHGRL